MYHPKMRERFQRKAGRFSEMRFEIPPRLRSRKLLIGVLAPAVIILNEQLSLGLDQGAVYAIAGVAAAYILGQGYVDSKH